jgi:hypothetical protein
MYKREAVWSNEVELFEPAARTGEMQCIDEYPSIVAVRRFDNPAGREDIRHYRPGKKLQQN